MLHSAILYSSFVQDSIGTLKGNETSTKSWRQLSETRSKVRLFLMQFLDHCSTDEDYIIKEPHILEKLCDIFFLDAKDKSVFYIGNAVINRFFLNIIKLKMV